jgi:two-component system phosphate regulon response regulator PhoB
MNGTMRSLVYIVEDDKDVAGLIRFNLETSGFQALHYFRGDEALAHALLNPPSLFLLDVMLPGIDGITLCRQIKSAEQLKRIPVIFVSAKICEDEKLEGFDAGADDYIAKPFSPRELVVRVEAVLRRYTDLVGPVIRFDNVEIDTAAMTLRVQGEHVPTTALEFRLLEFLARSPGLVFSRDRMLEAVWGSSGTENRRSVDVYIRKLREKIEPDPDNPQYLLTARGSGYMFVMPSFRIAS